MDINIVMKVMKIKSLVLSVLNQAVGSGVGFLTGLYFSMVLSAEKFGYWGIGFAAILFVGGIGNAMFLTQMVVNSPDVVENKKDQYYFYYLNLMLVFLVSGVLIVTTISVVLLFLGFLSKNHALFVSGVSMAASGYLLKDYFIRRAYIKRCERMALVINSFGAAMFFLLIFVSQYVDFIKDEIDATAMYGIIQIASASIGYHLMVKEVGFKVKFRLLGDFKKIILEAKWAVLGTVVTWIQSQAYVYGIAFLIGVSGVGLANAARIFTSPYVFLLPAINQLTMPRLSEMRVSNPDAVVRQGGVYTGILVLFGLFYSVIIVFYNQYFVNLLYGTKYDGIEAVVMAWCFVLISQLIRDGASTLMQSLKQFKYLAVYNIVTAVLCLIFTVVLSVAFDVVGSVAALGLGEFLLGIGLWMKINRHKKFE